MLFLLKFKGFINGKLANLLQNKASNFFILCNSVKKKNKQLLTALVTCILYIPVVVFI